MTTMSKDRHIWDLIDSSRMHYYSTRRQNFVLSEIIFQNFRCTGLHKVAVGRAPPRSENLRITNFSKKVKVWSTF